MPGPESPENSSAARGLLAGERVFQRYILRRPLGQGGMGVVWLAWDEKLEQEVALKFVADALRHDPNAIERLKRETRRNLQLAHPNIVRIHDFVQDDRFAAIAMESINGWSLWAMRVDRPHQIFSVEEIMPWVRQLISALDYAHREAQMVHRDLKPSNLLINHREQLKVSDFGIARSLGAQVTQTTGSGLVYGTVGYMSPQQALGEAPSVVDDVYSLGATIYELLTGTPPFYKGEIMAQVMDLTPPSMAERLHELDVEDVTIPWIWEDTVARCLAKNPAQRPDGVAEVLRLLERTDAAPRVVEKPTPDNRESPALLSAARDEAGGPQAGSPRNRLAMFAIGSAVLLMAVGGGVWVVRKFRGSTPAVPATTPSIVANVDAKPGSGRGTEAPAIAKLNPAFAPESTPPSPPVAAARPITAGTLDRSFYGVEFNGQELDAIAMQPDGKILMVGYFDKVGGDWHPSLARFHPDGTVDTSFKASAGGEVHGVALQPDGKIILTGNFRSLNGKSSKTAGRLTPEGAFDSTFVVGAGGDLEARAIGIQADGKILISGSFQRFNGIPRARMARLHATGQLDNGFNASFNQPPTCIIVQTDGRILVCGNFSSVNGTPARSLARLRADGSLDGSFRPNRSEATKAMALLSDGRIIVASHKGSVARLNADGSADLSFQTVAPANVSLQTMAVDHQGRIIVAGTFTNYAGLATVNLTRLNRDGTLDRTFQNTHPLSRTPRSLGVTASDDVIVGGNFPERLLRFHGGAKPASNP